MDLFFYLPKTVQENIFYFNRTSLAELAKFIQRINGHNITSAFETMSVYGLKTIPSGIIRFSLIDNPYAKWRRVVHKCLFRFGNWQKQIPDGAFKKDLKSNTAYIVDGYQAKGSYANVWTFVVFRDHKAVIKLMEFDEYDWFELVSQAYLYEACKKYEHVHVPRLLFLQRSSTHGTYACMERARGHQFSKLRGTVLLVAMAHAMKALYRLQNDVHFMHRDLSGLNITYDPFNHDITFIDFGMTCLNPRLHKLAWQSTDESFYLKHMATSASMCTNRSLDASMLISYSALQHTWLHKEHVEMKRDYTNAINNSDNANAKRALHMPKRETQYTTIRPGKWTVGNELSEGDGHHWWLFNLSEFPVERWYPENVLKRILRQIPLDHWFSIRRHWSREFDEFMPKDLRVQLKDGRTGILSRLVQRKCRVRVGEEELDMRTSVCRILK